MTDQRHRLQTWIASTFFAVLAICFAGSAFAADKPLRGVALVIGQSDYAGLPKLENPKNDARAMDDLLDGLGFDVTRVLDGGKDKLEQRISRFVDDAADADVAVVYYSGHGIEAGGEDYLVPVDADLSTPQSAGATLVPVSELLDQLAKKVPVTIVLLDACRTGAFPEGTMIQPPGAAAPVPAQETGLGVIRGPKPIATAGAQEPNSNFGVVIGFAASPGEPALDGAPGDENSPYATALLKHFGAPGYSFGDVMTMVSEEVYLKTGARQLPWVNSSLRAVLTFAPPDQTPDPDQSAIRSARRQLLLSIAGTPPETQKYVESLAGDEKVPLDALYGMLQVLGVKNGPDGGDLQQQLQKGAERLKSLVDEQAPASDDPELTRLGKLADEAQTEGAIALADQYRDEASARADVLLGNAQTQAARLKQNVTTIAATYAANAATASLNFDHLKAATLYGRAFEAIKDWDSALAITYKLDQGDALADQGYYIADNNSLRQAMATYQEVLPLAPRETNATDWGRVQDRVGQVQGMLGARLGDAKALNAAVESFNAALTVLTKDATPDRWAAVQNNLGNVLYDLGSQTDDVDLLQRSVAAFDSALEVYTHGANPVRWATVESNRGSSQIELAHAIYAATDEIQTKALEAGNKDVEHLPEVVAAIDKAVSILSDTVTTMQAAVAARPRSDNPLDWALVENTLASALAERAKLTNSADDLRATIDADRGVLAVYDPEKMPAQWSIAAGNLASTMRNYAALSKDPGPLTEATDLLDRALVLTPQVQSPQQWADLQTKLGNVWADRVGYDHDPASVDKAVAAYQASEQVLTPEADLDAWGRAQLYIVSTLLKTAVPTSDVVRLKQALAVATEAHDVLVAHGASDATIFANLLPTLGQFVAALSAQ